MLIVGDVKSGIVSAPTVHSLFRPDVPEKGEPIIKWVTGWSSAQFGYGLALNLEDWEGMRRSGSGFCQSTFFATGVIFA